MTLCEQCKHWTPIDADNPFSAHYCDHDGLFHPIEGAPDEDMISVNWAYISTKDVKSQVITGPYFGCKSGEQK